MPTGKRSGHRDSHPLLGDGTLGFRCGVADHLGGRDGGGEGDPSSEDVSLGHWGCWAD